MGIANFILDMGPRDLATTIKAYKLVSENNLLALGVAAPILLAIPGILDEVIAIGAFVALGAAAIGLRNYIKNQRSDIINKLDYGRDDKLITELEYSEAIRNLNAITVAR